jgi:hypothetical protein
MTKTIQTIENKEFILHDTEEKIAVAAGVVFTFTGLNYPESRTGEFHDPGFTFETYAHVLAQYPQYTLVALVPEDFSHYSEKLGFVRAMAVHDISIRAAEAFTDRKHTKNIGFFIPAVTRFVVKDDLIKIGILKAVL